MPKPTLAARAGRWSAQHRKIAAFGWIAFVIASVFLGGAIGTKHLKNGETGAGEAGRASRLLTHEFQQPAAEQVLVQSSGVLAHDQRFRAGVADVARRVSRVPVAYDVRSPLSGGGALSKDGHSALVTFRVRGDADSAKKRIAPVLAATAAAQKANPGVRIAEAGDASAAKALDKSFTDDFDKARTMSLPITLIILLIAFGALVAAGIPLLLAFSGVAATLGLVAIPSHIAAIDPAISEIVLLIGMAVGVDYSLFYLRRQREERAAGRSNEAAIEAAAATSGRAVLVSGLTVMAAMAGMYLTGDPTFSSFATGTIMVVAVAIVASLTVLPAVLSKLGDRVMKARVPYLGRRREAGSEPRVWTAILSRVLRRPLVSALVSGGLLVALTIPAFGLHTAQSGLQGLPRNLPITQTLNRIQAAFPGGAQPAQVVVQAPDVTAPPVAAAVRALQQRAVASHQMRPPFEVTVNRTRTLAVVSVPLVGGGTDATSNRALDTLRGEVIPATLGRVSGVRAQVTGMTANSKDFNDLISSRAPLVFGFVLLMAFGLLLVTFRSIVIPIKAIVLNMLSVGASYGVLVLVFQKGWGEDVLGFKSTGAIASWLPMFLFVILFGLSMDYHVFIISRIREAFDRGARTEDAVREGITATAGVVTSAAAVMVAVFAVFATLGALDFKQMGVGLAAAILIDATIVRAVLLPATMKLLGDRNWYLPKRLGWLPQVAHEPVPQPATP